ncbi:MAG: type 4a pilus biogenesis protein PilO [Inhella sp.]|jgi:type IV pilus assembly protein PilO|uniref:type 4a pilus biogenesis protein PilO n=1 Tax=Inhella sp. TaxID=1921806 RepID=UPI0022C2DCF6|nr:type 4a pilus biogenesis protein PilO [Inhella sp.]MCZ8234696.1 type 4a pilus biogenesis protein PilO [Inhella sp.]
MADKSTFDLQAWLADAGSQFQGLNTAEPGQWPWLPKLVTFIVVAVAAVVLGWFLLLTDFQAQLDGEVGKEPALRADYTSKVALAANRPELEKQKKQVEEYVIQLEKQLPSKAEMDALLSDINQAGIGRGLQFEYFRPGAEVIQDYYAEQPIALRVNGRYHDFGTFAGDVANLSRIVTLHNFQIGQANNKEPGLLFLETTARTYRYLDAAEVEEQKRAKAKEKEKAQAGGKK